MMVSKGNHPQMDENSRRYQAWHSDIADLFHRENWGFKWNNHVSICFNMFQSVSMWNRSMRGLGPGDAVQRWWSSRCAVPWVKISWWCISIHPWRWPSSQTTSGLQQATTTTTTATTTTTTVWSNEWSFNNNNWIDPTFWWQTCTDEWTFAVNTDMHLHL